MKKHIITTAVFTLTLSQATFAGPPDVREIHEEVIRRVKQVRDALVPSPAIEFVENFPPIAIPRAKVLQLAQAEPAAPVPPTAPYVDAAAIADWANNVAIATTHGALEGVFGGGSKARRPVIVSTSERDAKTIAALEEDLNVMMRILEKAASPREDGKATAMGIEILSGSSANAPRVFYLDGYGPMFLLRVKYALMAPPEKDDESRTNATTSSEWERTKEEVLGTRPALRDVKLAFDNAQWEPFDADRVDNLKQQIIEKLGEATHIRNIKENDYITVVILGGGPRVSTISRSNRATAAGRAAVEVRRSTSDSAGQTTMTLRAKKSDVDAFARGKTKIEEFRKKVSVQVH